MIYEDYGGNYWKPTLQLSLNYTYNSKNNGSNMQDLQTEKRPEKKSIIRKHLSSKHYLLELVLYNDENNWNEQTK